MMFGLAAATSALDLIKTLTSCKSERSSSSTSNFASKVGSDASASSQSSSTSASSSSRTSLAIAPETMTALLDAQQQPNTAASDKTGRSRALKELMSLLDGDGNGAISKSEFETALGAGGTNVANADRVFDKLDADGDGAVTTEELSKALKGKHGHRPPPPQDDAASLTGTSSATTTNADGSTTTSLTYGGGAVVSLKTAAPSGSIQASSSYRLIEQMIQRQADLVANNTAKTTPSVSTSV